MIICTECKNSIVDETDLINFTKVDVDVNYHRLCYATKFNAPHALLDENGIAKPVHPSKN